MKVKGVSAFRSTHCRWKVCQLGMYLRPGLPLAGKLEGVAKFRGRGGGRREKRSWIMEVNV